jgi:hypothetical protein
LPEWLSVNAGERQWSLVCGEKKIVDARLAFAMCNPRRYRLPALLRETDYAPQKNAYSFGYDWDYLRSASGVSHRQQSYSNFPTKIGTRANCKRSA